jgi:hypothetical protein
MDKSNIYSGQMPACETVRHGKGKIMDTSSPILVTFIYFNPSCHMLTVHQFDYTDVNPIVSYHENYRIYPDRRLPLAELMHQPAT